MTQLNQPSKLLQLMFEHDIWQEMIDRANDKEINLAVVKRLCTPEMRVKLYERIITENYEVAPPHIAHIPKDKPGEYREVYVNEGVDRIVLTLINECLCKLFSEMIHPQVKSYQKGLGCQETVQDIVREISMLSQSYNGQICKNIFIGYKSDLSKYFDSVPIEIIDSIFDEFERRLGFEHGTEPVINLLRKYYHNDWVFDLDGNLIQHYGSLKQGCAVASILSNIVLYDVDEALSNMDIIYYRYSDDIVMIGKDAEKAKTTLEEMLTKYGLKLNPKKVERLYSDKWFKFLGFNIKGNLITLSRNRVKNFQKEIASRTINKGQITFNQARKNVIHYLYEGDYCWATSCLGIVNCQPDLDEMNKFIMDCLRACKVRDDRRKRTKKKQYKISMDKIGGLGVVDNLEDRTILRGTGKNVTRNREQTDKEIENYLTVGCLAKAMKINKTIFGACVRGL